MVTHHVYTIRNAHQFKPPVNRIGFTDGVEQPPMPAHFFPGKEYGMRWIVDVGRLARCTVEFDDGKIFAGTKVFPATEFDIHPSIMESRYLLAYFIHCIDQRIIDPVTDVRKLSPPAMTAVRKHIPCPFGQYVV